MVTQCEAESKKNSSINLYAGIFDSKLFRRGGRVRCESKSDFEALSSDRGCPPHAANSFKGLTEDAHHATVGFKNHSVPSDDTAGKRNFQPHVSHGQGSLVYFVGGHSGSKKDLYKGDAELKATGVAEIERINCELDVIDEHVSVINCINKKNSIHLDVAAGKRSLKSDAGSQKIEHTNSRSNAGHQCHESRVGRTTDNLERKDLRGNGPQQALLRDEDSIDNVGLVAADLNDYAVPSTLPVKLCRKGVNLKKMEDYCTSVDALLQLDETPPAAEMLSTRSSVSVDEMCRLERRLSFTAVTDNVTSTEHGDVNVSHRFSFKRSNVDVVARGMDPGFQSGSTNETLNPGSLYGRNPIDYSLPVRNTMFKESMTINGLVNTYKSEVAESDRPVKESSNLQANYPSKIQDSGEVIYPGITKANKSIEQEPYGRNDTNGLAWKESLSREHPVLTSPARIGETISLDSLSSHGGSSSSGSPLASEALKDGRLASPGKILMSKGSPYSVSSRSMGSITGYDNAVNTLLSPTSSNESPGPHWQWNTRRSDEMMLATFRNSHDNLRGGSSSRGMKADGMNNSSVTIGNLSKENLPANGSGHGNFWNNGNLLVGGANGDVLSVSGATKGNIKQETTRQGTFAVDCRLMKRALATLDSLEVKNAGNEYYKAGHFSEALTLYDKAVALCPISVVYRSNKAAALSGLGQLAEAVKEYEEAIRLDPSYARAHQHVASLYIRLGMIEIAKKHLHVAGQHTDLIEVQRLQIIEKHIFKCIEARKSGDWHNVIKESDAAVVAGADSAPEIFGFKAEALFRLQKLPHADSVCNVAQKIESSLINLSIGSPNPNLNLTRAQVNMALGRFDEAILAAEAGARMEPNNAVAAALLRKARAIAQARATGNDFFKAGRLFEALASYAEGLESDPTNAVLLCNRAACRLKLGHWEKAVEDCDAALRARPNYTKARLRRASCLTKLERWEDALQDYEALKRELPGNADVDRALFDAQVAMKKSRGEEIRGMKFGGDVEEVSSEEQFREAVGSSGLSVVQFITPWSDRCQELSPFIDDLCRRHPCVNFVKVDVEELPYLARMESITFIPTFKIYKDGQKLKEIIGPSQQSLEYAVRHYSL